MAKDKKDYHQRVKQLHFDTLQSAWEGINEWLALNHEEVEKYGGGTYGTEWIAYNTIVNINKAQVDPDFDFGTVLGYNIKKWTTLIKNYVDFNYLDILKSEIQARVRKKAKSYNYAFRFSNKYGGGKDCLLSLVFSQRRGEDYPTVFFDVRVSEVTCRLIFDFLLVQRICEYVYGKELGQKCEIHVFFPSMYVTAERFSIYASYKGWDKIKPRIPKNTKFGQRMLKVWDQFINTPVETIRYKAHRRCAEVIQKDSQGNSVRYVKPMKAKELPLTNLLKKLPHDVITEKEIRNYIKSLGDDN